MIGYPLLLQPRYDEKIWGGRRLASVLHKPLPSDARYGESLESSDGATVANGPLAGQTLAALVADFPESLLGSRGLQASQPFGDFPLLVKFIDAADTLSLQVHPDDDGAALLQKRGKTEAWHVVAADPGATLITGVSAEVAAEEIGAAIEDGTFEALLHRRTVQAGDTLIIPAGTVHAIGGGIVLYEIQEASDVTFRLYDWGRVDSQGRRRELHLADALLALVPGRRATLTYPLLLDAGRDVLAVCRYFTLERWTVDGEFSVPSAKGESFRLLSCIEGACNLCTEGVGGVMLRTGQTALLPADLDGCRLRGTARILCGWIADLTRDVAGPLLDAGHHPEAIALLGGGIGDLQGALAAAQRERARRPRRRR